MLKAVKKESIVGESKKMVKKRGRPRKVKKKQPIAAVTAKPKEKIKKVEEKELVKKITSKKYLYAVGKRKSAIARVRYYKDGEGQIIINGKKYDEYFPYFEFQKIVLSPLELVNFDQKGNFSIKVLGGGKRGQSESIRHGITKILIIIDSNFKAILKKSSFITRDSRVKERKKYGLRGARRAPQWQKR